MIKYYMGDLPGGRGEGEMGMVRADGMLGYRTVRRRRRKEGLKGSGIEGRGEEGLKGRTRRGREGKV